MPAPHDGLAALQSRFAHALLDTEAAVPEAVRAPSAAQRLKRFRVYRNNVYASLIETLRGRFPVIARLTGGDAFAGIAGSFIAASPPRSPVLLAYGEAFPEFLAGLAPLADYPYMADVARLEWLRARAYHASDATAIDPALFQQTPPERIGDVVLTLHPSADVISSPFPIVAIWETNTHDDEVRAIGSAVGGQDALVLRRGLEVIVVTLGPGAHIFVTALMSGQPLADAVAAASAEPQFSLPHALAALIEAQAIVDFSLPAFGNDPAT